LTIKAFFVTLNYVKKPRGFLKILKKGTPMLEILVLLGKLILKPFKMAGKFLVEVKAEFSKVVWPTRQEAINLTIVVIVFSLIVALYLGALDYLFTRGLELLINNFS
jgi:preprotein translocase subunit SecE